MGCKDLACKFFGGNPKLRPQSEDTVAAGENPMSLKGHKPAKLTTSKCRPLWPKADF